MIPVNLQIIMDDPDDSLSLSLFLSLSPSPSLPPSLCDRLTKQ